MNPAKGHPGSTLDGNPEVQVTPFKESRTQFALPFEREQNGNLSDDPTESGEPVVNVKPFKNLRGGR